MERRVLKDFTAIQRRPTPDGKAWKKTAGRSKLSEQGRNTQGGKRKGSENGEEGVDKETDVAILQQQSIKSKAELSSGVVRATDVSHVRHVS